MARAALSAGAQILVYPELFLTGFCYETSLLTAGEDTTFSALDPFRELAEAHECLIIGSLRHARQNLGFCLDSIGLELRPKIHPFGAEKEHFDGGDFIAPVATKWGRVGLEICYDLRFPEVARSLALQGADFLVTVAQFPASRSSAVAGAQYCPGHRKSDSSSGLQLGEWRRLSDHQCPGTGGGGGRRR